MIPIMTEEDWSHLQELFQHWEEWESLGFDEKYADFVKEKYRVKREENLDDKK